MELSGPLAAAERSLRSAGIESARVDAELLAAHVLDVSRGRVQALVVAGSASPDGFADRFTELVEARAERVPLQHLTGQAHFRNVTLSVGPGVFVPRPETETVVQIALDWIEQHGLDAPVVADLGTGSGAIAASIASEVPGSRVTAVELSAEAAAWARRNLDPYGVELVLGDFRTALADRAGEYDVVISNPPYIPPDAVPIDPEVAQHDPSVALYGGARGGLEHPEAAARAAFAALRGGGLFVMEHGCEQGVALERVFADVGLVDVAGHEDLTGRRRATSGVKPVGSDEGEQ